MLVKTAKLITGGLSNTSKMPGKSYSIPADHCKKGSALREIEGSVCSKCYAMKGNYKRFTNVVESLERRYESLTHPDWVQAMVKLIGDTEYFRWHDAGDIQGMRHLKRIILVALLTPNTKHWLPTKELKLIDKLIDSDTPIPSNLVVRRSAPLIDSKIPAESEHPQVKSCRSITSQTVKMSCRTIVCPAPMQGGKCEDCRHCWNNKIADVAYLMH